MYYYGDYLVPTLHGSFWAWYGKPPFSNWLILLFYYILGINNWSVRLPFALTGLGTVFLIFLIGKKIDNLKSGFLASIFLSLMPGFISFSRIAVSDVIISFLFLIALYSYFLSIEKRKVSYVLASGFFIGIAILTKQMVGFIPLISILIFELHSFIMDKRTAYQRIRSLSIVTLISLIISGWWFLYLYARFGNQFLSEYFGYHLFLRLTTSLEGHGKNLFMPFNVLFDMASPLKHLIIIPLLFTIINLYKNKLFSLLLINASITFLIFGLISKTFLPWYLIPDLPIFAISLGYSFNKMFHSFDVFLKRFSNTFFKKVTFIALILLLLPFYNTAFNQINSNRQLITGRIFTEELKKFSSYINDSNVSLVYVEGEAFYQVDFYVNEGVTVKEWNTYMGLPTSNDQFIILSYKSYNEYSNSLRILLRGESYLLAVTNLNGGCELVRLVLGVNRSNETAKKTSFYWLYFYCNYYFIFRSSS
jgi:4-amino-4-deoxy-L-arabinose transferase-like glycosyltransferase